MNLQAFFDHWGIVENPFRGEEARQDPVFRRLEAHAARSAAAAGNNGAGIISSGLPVHSDFEKIVGDFRSPAASIVFGEKGAGKTTIRLQLDDRARAFNQAHPEERCLVVPYDDLNPILDRFVARFSSDRRPDVPGALAKFRLVDHIDAILTIIVPRVVDTLLMERQDALGDRLVDLGPEPRKRLRASDPSLRWDLLLLQTLYDRPEGAGAEARSAKLRRVLRLRLPWSGTVWKALAYAGWLVPAALFIAMLRSDQGFLGNDFLLYVLVGLTALYLAVLAKRSLWDRLAFVRLGHRVRRQLRVSARSDLSYARSLEELDPGLLDAAALPVNETDEARYANLDRLRRVLRVYGYQTMLIVIDRVDEPTLIAGEPDRMRSFIWPLLNNKFLQQNGVGVKMLLPIELRHALFRESAAFFQEARLDKQNLIERLSWSGATLYDLCDARLRACIPNAPAQAMSPVNSGEASELSEGGVATRPQQPGLLDLFASDVSRNDLIDALDQMRQPRDAFKMLYQCFTDHCSAVTQDQAQWRIPRHILDQARRAHVERLRQLTSGVRPA